MFHFSVCVCFMFCIHTRKLKKNEFTEINSDMPDTSESEEERLARLTKKDKNIKLNQITEGMFDGIFRQFYLYIGANRSYETNLPKINNKDICLMSLLKLWTSLDSCSNFFVVIFEQVFLENKFSKSG